METASIKKLKLNVTNIKSTLLKGNKKLIKIQGSNRKIMDADLRQKELSNKEKKIETPLVSKFKSTGKKISQKTGSMFSRIFEVLGLITAGIIINNIKTIIDKVKAIYTDLKEKITNFYEDNKGIFDLLGKFINVLKDGVMSLLSLIGGVDVEKQEKEQDETKKMVSELDTDKLTKLTEPMTGLIGKIKEALQGKKQIDEPSEKETEEYENGYQQYLQDNNLKDTVENKSEYTMSLEQKDSEPTKNSSNKGTTTTTTIKTSKSVSGRIDTNTGKTYINDKEVSADEYNVFANMSKKEQVQKYGQTQELSTSVNTGDNITPQKNQISSNNLKYDSNVSEGKQVIVLTKTKEKIKYVTKTVPV
tara:strand:+ start:682 stop:1764 length:1083 start_codon:yes stop_codon:yes gene_type:complete